jgi:hypothetical protein
MKNGKVRDKQRYKCKDCNYNFIPGDQRFKADIIKKSFALIMYFMGGISYKKIADIFNVSPTTVFKWVKSEGVKFRKISNYSTSTQGASYKDLLKSIYFENIEDSNFLIIRGKIISDCFAILLLSFKQ